MNAFDMREFDDIINLFQKQEKQAIYNQSQGVGMFGGRPQQKTSNAFKYFDEFDSMTDRSAEQEEEDPYEGMCAGGNCVFVVRGNGKKSCTQCGIILDYESEMDLADMVTKPTFFRQTGISKEVLQYMERSDLGTLVQFLADKNASKTPNAGMIRHYANSAIQEVNKYRTQFKIKGKTPIKLVALLVMAQTVNTCITKEEVIALFGLQGLNLSHTQSMLNEYRQQFKLFNCDKLISKEVLDEINQISVGGDKREDISELGSFLMSSSNQFQFTVDDVKTGDAIYQVLDRHRLLIGHTEQVRFRITACLLLKLCVFQRHQCQCPSSRKRKQVPICKRCFAVLYYPLSGQSKKEDATKQLKKYSMLWQSEAVREDLIQVDPAFANII